MSRTRVLVGGLLVALLLGSAVGYAVWRRAASADETAGFDPARTGTVLVVGNDGSRVEQRTRAGALVGRGPVCQRAYAAGGTLACLRSTGVPFSSELTVFRGGGAATQGSGVPDLRLDLWGNPSRSQVSPSGRFVAWTVFRSGDSYMQAGGFSTTAGFYDLETGDHYGSLEDFTVLRDGRKVTAADVNFWGITFAADDRTFYATLGSGGRTWLLRGQVGSRTLTTLREGVECPSLSPDGTRIAYKARAGDGWRAHVLRLDGGTDVALADIALAGDQPVDDQIAWVDDETVAYGTSVGGEPVVVTVPADGSGEPIRLLKGSSPSFP